MSLVTVKSKFQVTIPARLRKGLDLHEGDIMEATVFGDGLLLRPMDIVDRQAAADRIASILKGIERTPDDTGRTEDEIMQDAIAEISKVRRERRDRQP